MSLLDGFRQVSLDVESFALAAQPSIYLYSSVAATCCALVEIKGKKEAIREERGLPTEIGIETMYGTSTYRLRHESFAAFYCNCYTCTTIKSTVLLFGYIK